MCCLQGPVPFQQHHVDSLIAMEVGQPGWLAKMTNLAAAAAACDSGGFFDVFRSQWQGAEEP